MKSADFWLVIVGAILLWYFLGYRGSITIPESEVKVGPHRPVASPERLAAPVEAASDQIDDLNGIFQSGNF